MQKVQAIQLSDNQEKILLHALGLNRKNDMYRNRYYATTEHTNYEDLEAMRTMGLMDRNPEGTMGGSDYYRYFVTPLGKQVTAHFFTDVSPYKKDKGCGCS